MVPVVPNDVYTFAAGQSLLEYLCEMIPKLKSRSQSGATSQTPTSSGASNAGGGKKSKGGKKK